MIKCIVVDDEKLILDELASFIESCNAAVVGRYINPKTAIEELSNTKPDIAFLDIEMPEINGIDAAKRIIAVSPATHIVFITAYSGYALKAFGVSAIHYLLKPVNVADIKEAIDRVKNIRKMSKGASNAESADYVKTKPKITDRITLADKEDIIVIKTEDVLYLTSQNSITSIYTKNGVYKTRKSLAFWEDVLKKADFIRCHKAYIVNANYIYKMIHVLGEYKELLLSYCDIRIPISRRKINDVKSWLGVEI